MTDKQPDALRLADELEIDYGGDVVAHEAAAELRRLHKKCEALTADTIEEMRRITKIYRLEAERDELNEALNEALVERDEAEDYIDILLDEVLGTDRAEWSNAYGRADALEEVRERIAKKAEPVQGPVEETLWPVWNTLPTNKDIEDAMRIQRLNQIISPQRKWVGLTEGEIDEIDEAYWAANHKSWGIHDFARTIEAKLKEKNT